MTRTDLTRRILREVAITANLAESVLVPALGTLPRSHFALLSHLEFTTNRNESPGDLARIFLVSAPAMTQTLARMQDAGLVELRRAPHDARAKIVSITAQGRRTFRTVDNRRFEALQALAERLEAVELDSLLTALQHFRTTAEDTLLPVRDDGAAP